MEVDLDRVIHQVPTEVQDYLLVEHLLTILLVDLVEVRKDPLGEQATEAVVLEHTEIQDLSGELDKVLTPPTLEEVVVEQALEVLITPPNLMVEMVPPTLGLYQHGEILKASLAVAAVVVLVQVLLDLVVVLQEEIHQLQILPLVVMITLAVAVAVDQVVVQQSMAHLVDLVLL